VQLWAAPFGTGDQRHKQMDPLQCRSLVWRRPRHRDRRVPSPIQQSSTDCTAAQDRVVGTVWLCPSPPGCHAPGAARQGRCESGEASRPAPGSSSNL